MNSETVCIDSVGFFPPLLIAVTNAIITSPGSLRGFVGFPVSSGGSTIPWAQTDSTAKQKMKTRNKRLEYKGSTVNRTLPK